MRDYYRALVPDKLRERMEKETEEFLANGGVIQKIPPNVSGYQTHTQRQKKRWNDKPLKN